MTQEKSIQKEVVVDATPKAVWERWTTPKGTKSFFSPDCTIEFKVHGKYEMIFLPEGEPGKRGGEGCIILGIQPEKMLTFTWNAPPPLPEAREQRTVVIVRLHPISDQETKVTLTHVGWGDGGEWDQAYSYFDQAWGIVMYRLKWSLEHGPVDWNNPPRPE